MNDLPLKLDLEAIAPATERPISIAIVAMGGQGGGVLTNWVTQLAENAGWIAQATSVPGVAQRTGATIYYIEMMQAGPDGQRPVLAQMPTAGDVDIVIAAEFMEAGRSILRGLVTPERTTLIASSHRALATSEKISPGGAIADSSVVKAAIGVVAKREIVLDLEALAAREGSVISSALFGGLAASNALPFDHGAYRDVLNASGRGIEASLRSFDEVLRRVGEGIPVETSLPDVAPFVLPNEQADPVAQALIARIRTQLPEPAHQMAYLGVQKVVAFQDADYGGEYLDILQGLYSKDVASGGEQGFAFTLQAAKYLANAMAYDDLIRVARLKTAGNRHARIASEMALTGDQLMTTTEFMRPRMAELTSALPLKWARWLEARPKLTGWLDRRINKGRRVKTTSLRWFLVLHALGGMKRWRRGSARHAVEVAHRDAWLEEASAALEQNYVLGVEVLKFQRLIKGYSDTHARGLSKFDRVMQATKSMAARDDAADWARRLTKAAISDASDDALNGALETIASFQSLKN